MTTIALPTRTADVGLVHTARPETDAAHPPRAPEALERSDRRLSRTTHTVTAPDRQAPSRPAPRRAPRTCPPAAPPPVGRVLPRHTARNAEPRPARPTWDRMRFLPALPDEPALQECDVVALSTIRESRRLRTQHALPDPVRTAQVIITAAAEVLAGWRPAEHLGRWASPELYDALARRAGLARRILGESPDPRPRVRTLRVQLTASGACEVCAVLDDGERVRGAGARIEPHRGRWLLTSLEIA